MYFGFYNEDNIDSYISKDCCNSCVCVMLVQFMFVYICMYHTSQLLQDQYNAKEELEEVKVRSSVLQYHISLNTSPVGIINLEYMTMTGAK